MKMLPPLKSFVSRSDLASKNIYPFNTNTGFFSRQININTKRIHLKRESGYHHFCCGSDSRVNVSPMCGVATFRFLPSAALVNRITGSFQS